MHTPLPCTLTALPSPPDVPDWKARLWRRWGFDRRDGTPTSRAAVGPITVDSDAYARHPRGRACRCQTGMLLKTAVYVASVTLSKSSCLELGADFGGPS